MEGNRPGRHRAKVAGLAIISLLALACAGNQDGDFGRLPPSKASEASLVMARSQDEAGNEKEAIQYYELALKNKPSLKAIRHRLALLYDRQGVDSKAEDNYRLALKESPADPGVHNDYGYFCYLRGRFGDAEGHLRRAVVLDHAYERAWVNLGLTEAQMGNYPESLGAFTTVMSEPEARTNIALVMAQKGQYDRARDLLNQALEADPSIEQARVALTWINQHPQGPDKTPEPPLQKR